MEYHDTRIETVARALANELIRDAASEGMELSDRQAAAFRLATAHAATSLADRDLIVFGDRTWERPAHGLCVTAGADPEDWFPLADETGNPRNTKRADRSAARAERACDGCPVTGECLSLALDIGRNAEWGIWGGVSRHDRRALRPLWVEFRRRLAEANTLAGQAA